jgi:hypothetical protein
VTTRSRLRMVTALVVCAGCYSRPSAAEEEALLDAASLDAIATAGELADAAAPKDAAEPDAGCTCADDKPVCLDDGSCAACSADDTTACPTDKPLCDEANACVACLENADCKSETAPVCSAGECVPCSNDAGCSDRGQICDTSTGQCEGCTLAREAERCGENSCDPKTLACTGTQRGSVTICRACVADSECEADHRCIPMYFGTGDSRVELGGRCMRRLAAGCDEPYSAPRLTRGSLSGAAEDAYCGVAESRTSCEAILGLIGGAKCEDGSDATCNGAGALCRAVNGTTHRCTYACESTATCPGDFPCAGSGADRYCGQ